MAAFMPSAGISLSRNVYFQTFMRARLSAVQGGFFELFDGR
jgi:hypothetical protein